MTRTMAQYVFRTCDGGWRITGTRVSLDSVVHAYWSGNSPEQIVADFSALTLEQVHGALAFYLHNRAVVDRYLVHQSQTWSLLKDKSARSNAPLLRRLRKAAGKEATSGKHQ